MLLFNSDRVIDLARHSCVCGTYVYACMRNTLVHTSAALAAVRGGNARESIFAGLGARRRGKVSFNDFDMGGRHVPPCNLHYSRDVSAPAKHRRVADASRLNQRER